MNHQDLIFTVTGGLAAALFLGYLSHLIRLSPIVGYLAAGFLVGPNTPGYIANPEVAQQLAEIGVILLMFGVGLHFHFEELVAVKRIAVPGALAQGLVATSLGVLLGLAAGWTWQTGLVFGLALSVASTVVLTRVLSDSDEMHRPIGKIAMGWLVVQDILAVLVLVILPALFGKQEEGAAGVNIGLQIVWALVKIGVLAAAVLVLGARWIPWVLHKIAATRSRELFTLTILVVALGIAVGSAQLFGVSMALGAFLAGMVVGRSDFSVRAATEALPMRDAFAVLFFVSVGMLFNPRALIEVPGLMLATLAIVMIATPLTALTTLLVLGYPLRIAVGLALALAQIGEFSFIIAELGHKLEILDDGGYQALVATAMVTISLNAIVYRFVDPVERWLLEFVWFRRLVKRFARWRTPDLLTSGEAEEPIDPSRRAVIVGYGPVGRTVARLLAENEIVSTIIEMNVDTVAKLRAQKIKAIYGDANHRETLIQAGLAHANILILSSSGIRGGEEVIRLARQVNPNVRILVRSAYLHERKTLIAAGANRVFAGEGEVALAMTESILTTLGATPEQIDRERAQLREDFFGDDPQSAVRNIPSFNLKR